MINQYSRSEILLSKEVLEKLWQARVAIFGLGGVGGNALEALARAGIGHFVLIDDDTFSITNLNRQLLATRKTINRPKVEVAKERVLDINPEIEVKTYQTFYLPEKKAQFDFSSYDYIIDAIDTVTAKIDIIMTAKEKNVPIISAMGCGNRMDPTKLRIMDIYDTYNDPLAKVMRHELKKRGVKDLKVVFSIEEALKPDQESPLYQECLQGGMKKNIPGSTPFVPPAAGILLAYQVVMDLTSLDKKKKENLSQDKR